MFNVTLIVLEGTAYGDKFISLRSGKNWPALYCSKSHSHTQKANQCVTLVLNVPANKKKDICIIVLN